MSEKWLQLLFAKANVQTDLERGKNGFHEMVRVFMPKNSEYAGYYFEISKNCVTEQRQNYCVSIPPEYYTVVLVKDQGREPGKRYPRPKLTPNELAAAVAEEQERLDRQDGEAALAMYNEYDYKGGIEWDRHSVFAVGRVQGAWFWTDSETRRRISAPNFRLLRYLKSPEEIAETQEEIAELKKQSYYISEIERYKDIASKLYLGSLPENRKLLLGLHREVPKEIVENVAAAADQLMGALQAGIETVNDNIGRITAKLMAGATETASPQLKAMRKGMKKPKAQEIKDRTLEDE